MLGLRRALAGAGAAAVLAFLAASPASAQTFQDKLAIDNLLAEYSYGLDNLLPDVYAGTFTEDADFGEGERARHGRAEIRKVITELIERNEKRAKDNPGQKPARMHHVITNGQLNFTSPTQATFKAYWMTVIATGDNKITIAAMGHYEDVIVKTKGKWLFKSRKIMP